MLEMEALQGERTVSRPMQNLSPDSIACGNGMEARKCKESFDVSCNHCVPRIQTELLYIFHWVIGHRKDSVYSYVYSPSTLVTMPEMDGLGMILIPTYIISKFSTSCDCGEAVCDKTNWIS